MEQTPIKIQLVEDDLIYSELISFYLRDNLSCNIETYYTGKDLLNNLNPDVDIIVLDYVLPDLKGDAMFGEIKMKCPNAEVIFLTAYTDLNKVVELIRLGAYDYILKDEHAQSLLVDDIQKIHEKNGLKRRVEQLHGLIQDNYKNNPGFLGQHPDIVKASAVAEKIAPSSIGVSIVGEAGTGKEYLARIIHMKSGREVANYVYLNLEAVPVSGIREALWGSVQDARHGSVGALQRSINGTLVINAPEFMSREIQADLLDVIKRKELLDLSIGMNVPADIRVILTSSQSLQLNVGQGSNLFLSDFYFQFAAVQLDLPPLRNRKMDILPLAKQFLNDFTKLNKMEEVELAEDAKQKLLSYNYPGNLHEMKNVLELALAMSDKKKITAIDITFAPVQLQHNFLVEEKTLDEYNAEIVKHFLKKYNEDVNLVAEKLGVGRSTVYKWLREGKLDK